MKKSLLLVPLLIGGACNGDMASNATPPDLNEALCIQSQPPLKTTSPPTVQPETMADYIPPDWLQVPLPDTALAINRFMSHITWRTENPEALWSEWWLNPQQHGLDGVRYPLAFTAYAAFLTGARTPAYTEVSAKQMRDSIERMLKVEVWNYIESYWADEPTFPDPVYVENVMYSGHLLQMMVMYQMLTGDDRYATEGFDFIWVDGTVIHYDLHSLASRIHTMMWEHDGGLPCEPNLVFIYCNNHSALGITLYDRLYPSGYGEAVERWRRYVQRLGPFRIKNSPSFFRIVYLDNEAVWVPYGEAGGDAWGLGWMAPWNDDVDFIEEGWQSLMANARTIESPNGTHIDASIIMDLMLVSDATATSFLPLLARQVEGAESPVASEVFRWFDDYQTWWDGDGDGYPELLSFHSDDMDRNVVTANLAAGLVTLGPEMMQSALQHPAASFGTGYTLTNVDALSVEVPLAHRLAGGGVRLQLSPILETGVPMVDFTVIDTDEAIQVLRDGLIWPHWQAVEGGIEITTDLHLPHTFEVLPL